MIDTPDERNINIVVEEHASSEKIHFDIVVDEEVGIASTFLNKSSTKLSLFRKWFYCEYLSRMSSDEIKKKLTQDPI